ncbi:unnamed protein product [Sphagnum jensenii]|uniref:Beta-lactamase-related domain-containing protein n=1 Tax=Sphagnum jensenii TaxID=128206 RepID=A0ABP0VIN6_9BRYO
MGSVCISMNGKMLYSHTTGYSSMEGTHAVSANENTKYRIASITKMFTAAIIFQLIQEGKLDYSNTLDQFLPGLPGASKITIAMMMSHRSGLHNILDDPDYPNWKSQPKTKEEVLKMINRYPLDFAPDSKAAYSNTNYILLGYIIEEKCGKPYSEKQVEADMSILAGAGALLSTPDDLNKFIQGLYAHKLFKSRYLLHMQSITDGFGMGMTEFVYGEHKAYGHTGSIDGFNSQLEYFPDDKLAIAYCSNGLSIPIADVLNEVHSIVYQALEEYK